jgi:hypothetical protein
MLHQLERFMRTVLKILPAMAVLADPLNETGFGTYV